MLARSSAQPSAGWSARARRVAVVVLVVAVWHPRYYSDSRYDTHVDRGALHPWSQTVRDARIGTIGILGQVQYPLAGPDLSNHARLPRGGDVRTVALVHPATCEELMRLIEAARLDHVVTYGRDLLRVGGRAARRPPRSRAIFPMSRMIRCSSSIPNLTDRHC